MSTSNSRATQLRNIVRAYFEALRSHSVSGLPYSDHIVLRSPLVPGDADQPLTGKKAVMDWLASIVPYISRVEVGETYLNERLTAVIGAANIEVTIPFKPHTVQVAVEFTVNDEGWITRQIEYLDPRPVTQPKEYVEHVQAYTHMLASDDPKEVEALPYAEHVVYRAPLGHGGKGREVPMLGRQAAMEYLLGLQAPGLIDEAEYVATCVETRGFLEPCWVAGRFMAGFPKQDVPGKRLSVVDMWKFDPRTGLIVEQENFYDPRPALGIDFPK
jgi:hypothetical protein